MLALLGRNVHLESKLSPMYVGSTSPSCPSCQTVHSTRSPGTRVVHQHLPIRPQHPPRPHHPPPLGGPDVQPRLSTRQMLAPARIKVFTTWRSAVHSRRTRCRSCTAAERERDHHYSPGRGGCACRKGKGSSLTRAPDISDCFSFGSADWVGGLGSWSV